MTQPPPIRKILFPVAGQGTRLFPLSRAVPKELMRVAGNKPLIHYALAEASAAGMEECVFITGANRAALQRYLNDQNPDAPFPRLKRIFIEQESPKGLGDAVLRGRDYLGDAPFAVLLPDDLIEAPQPALRQMIDIYEKTGGQMVALENVPRDKTARYGIVDVMGETRSPMRVEALVEKPRPEDAPSTLAIIGRYILDPVIFQHLAETRPGAGGEVQLTDGMARSLRDIPLRGLRVKGRRFDCGKTEGLDAAALALLQTPLKKR